jgi:hypothetical protein
VVVLWAVTRGPIREARGMIHTGARTRTHTHTHTHTHTPSVALASSVRMTVIVPLPDGASENTAKHSSDTRGREGVIDTCACVEARVHV